MSDRFPAQILIGGEVSETVLSGLVKALHADGASHEYGDAVIPEDCTTPTLYSYLDENLGPDETVLRFRHEQIRNGEFEETEQFCIENDIAFDRWSDHYCEYDAENVYWRPGMNSPTIRYADARTNEIVCGATVRLAMAAFEESRTQPSHTMKTDRFEAGTKLLRDACPELPPDLEPFKAIKVKLKPMKPMPLKVNYVCSTCGSDDVRRDATAAWDVDKQEWELAAVLDQGYCEGKCEGERNLKEVTINGGGAG